MGKSNICFDTKHILIVKCLRVCKLRPTNKDDQRSLSILNIQVRLKCIYSLVNYLQWGIVLSSNVNRSASQHDKTLHPLLRAICELCPLHLGIAGRTGPAHIRRSRIAMGEVTRELLSVVGSTKIPRRFHNTDFVSPPTRELSARLLLRCCLWTPPPTTWQHSASQSASSEADLDLVPERV